jgi:hypothetical protein
MLVVATGASVDHEQMAPMELNNKCSMPPSTVHRECNVHIGTRKILLIFSIAGACFLSGVVVVIAPSTIPPANSVPDNRAFPHALRLHGARNARAS